MAQEDIRMKQTWHLSPAASKSSHRRGSDLPEGSGPFSHVELSSRPCFDCYSLLPAGNGTACRRQASRKALLLHQGKHYAHGCGLVNSLKSKLTSKLTTTALGEEPSPTGP
ncbi:hypothetical protein AV530_018862 [Patagioenas fasciata monilis]|uniref:Uncharacterized protein n=1 Tax=Patagioenas fasciata monilis TaxID=372326 RepID=A0A1V4JK73_PATFA|nr:hypothetical protein AV530_018862 [Patagioenas fasciata monilis]